MKQETQSQSQIQSQIRSQAQFLPLQIFTFTQRGITLGRELLTHDPQTTLHAPAHLLQESPPPSPQEVSPSTGETTLQKEVPLLSETPAFSEIPASPETPVSENSTRENFLLEGTAATAVAQAFEKGQPLLFIAATGIALRLLQQLPRHKGSDPAVLVMDDTGRHVISLLSGHLGGANALAREVARLTGARPVITTASDNSNVLAVDQLAQRLHAPLTHWTAAKKWTAAALEGRPIPVYSSEPLLPALPAGYQLVEDKDTFLKGTGGIWIGTGFPEEQLSEGEWVHLLPRRWVLGVGCRKNTTLEALENALEAFLEHHQLSSDSLAALATIDLKTREPGLQALAEKWELSLQGHSPEAIAVVQHHFPASAKAAEAVGVTAVSSPAAWLSSGGGTCLLPEEPPADGNPARAAAGITFTLAPLAGSVTVVGIGPGLPEHMTPAVAQALTDSHVVIGYHTYTRRLAPLVTHQQVIHGTMRRETQRCRQALELAAQGNRVLLVSSGDAGVYGMAGLLLELQEQEAPLIPVEILPGVTAATAAAARLGAPLMQDYATISLSDHLTPWQDILDRLKAAAATGFVIALYNPKSRERVRQWEEAVALLQQTLPPETPVGVVTRAQNTGEVTTTWPLSQLLEAPVDMQTVVIIGNRSTRLRKDGRMVTPRGYAL
ncbi:precorrin-3B C(17)-methyltransferase [Anoxynatronum sibiricum]|uniref:Precorrin-3B C(17)-methyltransferase n=1 Tax=Anoxynatronum sibiricum TaxID=210623 RepID=A0ABU9VSR6_9CLOT